ncbi:MAG: DUF4432 family protein [Firmicutes bacterium]|nr:DUF4432 family protein [Bacillota bacterium]
MTVDVAYRGMQTAVLENEALRISILLDKGAEIIEFLYKPLDIDFMYLAPWGVKNPRRDVPAAAIPDAGFLDYYSGGWQEILPNGGPRVVVRGASYGQHGDVSLIPWSCRVTEDGPDRVALALSVRSPRTPLYLEKELSLERGRAVLVIKERLTNESPVPVDLMWGHHVAFGGVLIEPGVRIAAPAERLLAHDKIPGSGPRRLAPGQTSTWPYGRGPGGERVAMDVIPPVPAGGCEEMAYLSGLREGWYAVTHPARRVGFALRWDAALFPYLCFGSSSGEPRTIRGGEGCTPSRWSRGPATRRTGSRRRSGAARSSRSKAARRSKQASWRSCTKVLRP